MTKPHEQEERFILEGSVVKTLHGNSMCFCLNALASWSSGNAFVSGVGDLRFKPWAGQIGHSVANGSPPLRYFFDETVLPGRNDAKIGPTNSLHALAYYSEYNERFD